MPFTNSWMANRFPNVVLPEEEGPAISTTFTFFCFLIWSAIWEIFFSCRASLTLIISPACLCSMAWFKCPICITSEIFPQRLNSLNVLNSFSWGTNGTICVGFVRLGGINNIPSL